MAGFTGTKDDTTPQDTEWATALYEALALANKTGKANIQNWANQFRMLRAKEKPATIQTILEWYIGNLNGPYTPKAFSAESFRKKFDRVVEAKARAIPNTGAEPSPAALQLSKELGLRWPLPSKDKEHFSEGTKRQEPSFIETTLRNYDAWRTAVIAARDKAVPDSLDHRLLNHIIASLGERAHFAETYTRHVHALAWRWHAWRGNLAAWAWRATDKHYVKALAATVGEFCGTARSLPWLFGLTGIKYEGELPSGSPSTDDF